MQNKAPSIQIGDIFYNNEGICATVVDYIRYSQIKVRFLDDSAFEKVFHGKALKRGQFKNPYTKSVCGVGYLGSRRVLCYAGVSVCEEWHNFQNFAKWFYEQKSFHLNWELDKDLVNGSSKYYSPENCCLLPKKINRFLVGKRTENGLPAGVRVKHLIRGVIYTAKSYNSDGNPQYLGDFLNEDDAFIAFSLHKKNTILELAEMYKTDLCEKSYIGLLNFKVRREYG